MDHESGGLSESASRWLALALGAAWIGWTVFVVATFGSAEGRYYRTCGDSCLGEMPQSYATSHVLLGAGLIGVPAVLAFLIWKLTRWW